VFAALAALILIFWPNKPKAKEEPKKEPTVAPVTNVHIHNSRTPKKEKAESKKEEKKEEVKQEEKKEEDEEETDPPDAEDKKE
jgi:hypothetical protein